MARTNVIDEYVLARLHLGMKIVDAIKVFFKGRKAAVNTALSASMAADNAFSDALDAISPYSKLSIRRDAISTALRNLEEKMTQARLDEYNEQIRDADPAEVAAYSRAELDAHTAAIEALDAAFDAVTESVANLNSGNEIYDLSVAFREASREAYVGAAMAYLIAARRAEILAGSVSQSGWPLLSRVWTRNCASSAICSIFWALPGSVSWMR